MEPSLRDTHALSHRLKVFDHRSPYEMFSKGIRKNQVVRVVPGISGFGAGKALIAPLLLKGFHYNGSWCDRPPLSTFRCTEEVFPICALQLLLHIDDTVFEIHIGPRKS